MLCECGCGLIANNRFVDGHQRRGKTLSKESREKISNAHKGRPSQYKGLTKEEITKLKNKKIRIKRKCLCGCGNNVKSATAKYIKGHSTTGRKLTKEQRKALSNAHKGQVPWNKLPPKPRILCGCGCGELAQPGNKFITGHNARGKSVSQTTRLRLSKSKGGSRIWLDAHPYVTAPQFNRLRKRVFERDNNKCIFNNNECDGYIGAHHVVPIEVGKNSKLCDDESNLVTLCNKHHKTIEPVGRGGRTDKWKTFLPIAKKYLYKFRYKELLLTKYLR